MSDVALCDQVDVMHIKKPLILFQWMGMNALIVYVLAACELFPTLVQGFYWRSPENNLVCIFHICISCHTCFHWSCVLSPRENYQPKRNPA